MRMEITTMFSILSDKCQIRRGTTSDNGITVNHQHIYNHRHVDTMSCTRMDLNLVTEVISGCPSVTTHIYNWELWTELQRLLQKSSLRCPTPWLFPGPVSLQRQRMEDIIYNSPHHLSLWKEPGTPNKALQRDSSVDEDEAEVSQPSE